MIHPIREYREAQERGGPKETIWAVRLGVAALGVASLLPPIALLWPDAPSADSALPPQSPTAPQIAEATDPQTHTATLEFPASCRNGTLTVTYKNPPEGLNRYLTTDDETYVRADCTDPDTSPVVRAAGKTASLGYVNETYIVEVALDVGELDGSEGYQIFPGPIDLTDKASKPVDYILFTGGVTVEAITAVPPPEMAQIENP